MYHKTRMKIKWTLFAVISLALFVHFSLIFYQFTDEIKKDYREKTTIVCNQMINNFSVRIKKTTNTIDFYNKYELSKSKFEKDNSVLARVLENITALNPEVSLAFVVSDDYEYYNKIYAEKYVDFFPDLKNKDYLKNYDNWKIINKNGACELIYLTKILDINNKPIGMSAFLFNIEDLKNIFYKNDNMFTEASAITIDDGTSQIHISDNDDEIPNGTEICKKNIDNMSISATINYKYIFNVYVSLFFGLLVIYLLTMILLYIILNNYSKYIFKQLNNIKENMEVFRKDFDWQQNIRKEKHIFFDKFQMRNIILGITIVCCFFVSGITTWFTYLYAYNVVLNQYAEEYSEFVLDEMENNIVGITEQINSISLNMQSVSAEYIRLQRTSGYETREKFINGLFESISLEDSEIAALCFITNDGIVFEESNVKGLVVSDVLNETEMLKNNTITILSHGINKDGVTYCMVGRKVFNYSSHYDFGDLICLIPADKMVLINDYLQNNKDTYFITIGDVVVSHTEQEYIGKSVYLPTQYEIGSNIFVQDTIGGHRFSEPVILNGFISTNEFIELINHIAYRLIILYIIMTMLILCIAYFLPKQLLKDVRILHKNLEEFFCGNDSFEGLRGGSEFVFLNQSFYAMATRIENLIKKIEKEKDKQRTLEIELLHAQINPHFIYNVLDSISWEAKAAEQYKIDEMIITLGKYLRTGLHRGSNMIAVSQEVEHVKNYLNLEKNRFGNMFDCCYIIDDSIHNKKMLKILLQPIVENCVKHAFDSDAETGLIILKATPEKNGIRFEIKDNGKGFAQKNENEIPLSSRKGGGVGLQNVNDRLILWYGDSSALKIQSSLGNGTVVSFWIPYNYEDVQ